MFSRLHYSALIEDLLIQHTWRLREHFETIKKLCQNLGLGCIPMYEQNQFPEPGSWWPSYIGTKPFPRKVKILSRLHYWALIKDLLIRYIWRPTEHFKAIKNCVKTWDLGAFLYMNKTSSQNMGVGGCESWLRSYIWTKPFPRKLKMFSRLHYSALIEDLLIQHTWRLREHFETMKNLCQNLGLGCIPMYEQNQFPEPGSWWPSYIGTKPFPRKLKIISRLHYWALTKDLLIRYIWRPTEHFKAIKKLCQNLGLGCIPIYEQNEFPEPGSWGPFYIGTKPFFRKLKTLSRFHYWALTEDLLI